MRTVVTGGAGFIGSHLADALLAKGHEVVVIDDLSSGVRSNLAAAARLVRKDVRSDLSRELSGADTVFHMAGESDVGRSALEPGRSFDTNVAGTFSVLESCRKAGVRHAVLASSSTVYGTPALIPTPETHPCAPISNYGASKLSCEAYLSSFSATYGLRGTSMRLANIYGERSSRGVIHDFFEKLAADPRRLEIRGDGKQDKSYLHVSDCVKAILAAWEGQEARYDVFNAGGDVKVTVDELAGRICAAMGLSPALAHLGEGGSAWDVRVMLLECSKLKRLGWKPGLSLDDGLARYRSWLGKSVKKKS